MQFEEKSVSLALFNGRNALLLELCRLYVLTTFQESHISIICYKFLNCVFEVHDMM